MNVQKVVGNKDLAVYVEGAIEFGAKLRLLQIQKKNLQTQLKEASASYEATETQSLAKNIADIMVEIKTTSSEIKIAQGDFEKNIDMLLKQGSTKQQELN